MGSLCNLYCGRCENGICLIDKTSCYGLCEELKVEKLYNAGYHKVEEVRKETAKKIYLQAKAIVDATKQIVQGKEYIHIDALKEIIKNCGVEIKD